jgi:hypothetical protein
LFPGDLIDYWRILDFDPVFSILWDIGNALAGSIVPHHACDPVKVIGSDVRGVEQYPGNCSLAPLGASPSGDTIHIQAFDDPSVVDS